MKREIIPGRFILLILAAFLAIMVLPIVLASLSGQLDLPVEQSYASDAQELTIAPKADWSIVSVLPQEDGLLAPEMTGEGVTVPLAGLPAGEAETLQLLCRSQDGGPAEETQGGPPIPPRGRRGPHPPGLSGEGRPSECKLPL